jgi:cell division protein FtsI/penicillin-binding protein 2
VYVLGTLIFVSLGCIILRVGILTLRDHDYYTRRAAGQRTLEKRLATERGEIFFEDRFGNRTPAAINDTIFELSAVPKEVADLPSLVRALAPLLEIPDPVLAEKLGNAEGRYVTLKSGLGKEKKSEIEKLGVPGLSFRPAAARVYPAKDTAALVTGFFGFDEGKPAGQYGLEEFYEEELRGMEGSIEGERDTLGRVILAAVRAMAEPHRGADLVLTIDPNVQAQAARVTKEAVERWQAESGLALVLRPDTGGVLAMASYPSYDPNAYKEAPSISLFANPAVQKRFEPGSVFKPFTMAAGLLNRAVTPETAYEDPGGVKFGGYTIKNFDEQSHGIQTMTQVLEKSLNTGAMFVEALVGKERFLEMVKDFGFNEKTEIDSAGESVGDIRALETFSDLQFATASFGQGIAVTPIALARAMGAVANGGNLVRPFLVEKRIVGNVEIPTRTEVLRRVLPEETARTLARMLVSVVDNGAGYKRRAKMPGYAFAGKTGTAQVPSPDGGYSGDVIHSFIGFGPVEAYASGTEPSAPFLVLLKMDKPKGERFAANTLTATFREIAEFLVKYYEIPPDRPGEVGKHE